MDLLKLVFISVSFESTSSRIVHFDFIGTSWQNSLQVPFVGALERRCPGQFPCMISAGSSQGLVDRSSFVDSLHG